MELQIKSDSIEQIYNFLPQVKIDLEGKFKYVIVTFFRKPTESKERKPMLYFIRGYSHCNYHADIVDEFQEELTKCSSKPEFQLWQKSCFINSPENSKLSSIMEIDCEGGGRIIHSPHSVSQSPSQRATK